MVPMFSLMVLSEMKAGYSVSHGNCMLRPVRWAENTMEAKNGDEELRQLQKNMWKTRKDQSKFVEKLPNT